MTINRFGIQGVEKLISSLRGVEREAAPKAGARALNRVAGQTATKAARSIKAAMGVTTLKPVKRTLSVNKAKPTNLKATIKAKGGFIPLIEFGARQTKKGVTHKVYGSKKLKRHAFIAKVGGADHVFLRKDSDRLPIKKQFGPSVPLTFASDAVMNGLKSFANEALERRFVQEVKFEVGRIMAKR